MAKQGFRSDGNTPYVYQENTTSVAFGIDSSASNVWRFNSAPTANVQLSNTANIEIDPNMNGNVTFRPNGTGNIQLQDTTDITLTGGVLKAAVTSGAVAAIAPSADGQLLIGASTGSFTWQTLTAGTGMSIVNGPSSTTLNASATTPLSFPTDSGTATPALNALTVVGAGGITTSGSGATLTITGSGAGFTWNDVTGTSASMAVNNGYVADNAALVTLTLPSTAAFGSLIEVTGGVSGTGLWKIAQNSGQTIHFGNVATTTGVGGYLQATAQYDSVRLLCNKANTDWVVLPGTQGNITYV
jgi:hypothetical protein